MQSVELVRAEQGAKKVSCTQTLQSHCGLGLARAKQMTDAVLERKYPTVPMQSGESARSLIVALAELGVVARFAEGPNYNPQERLASAWALAQPLLKPQVILYCQSLCAHGEWELALSHCLAHLPLQETESAALALETLSILAIEFGIVQRNQK